MKTLQIASSEYQEKMNTNEWGSKPYTLSKVAFTDGAQWFAESLAAVFYEDADQIGDEQLAGMMRKIADQIKGLANIK